MQMACIDLGVDFRDLIYLVGLYRAGLYRATLGTYIPVSRDVVEAQG